MVRYTMTDIEDQFRDRYLETKRSTNEIVAVVMPMRMADDLRYMLGNETFDGLTYHGLPVFPREIEHLELEVQMVMF